MSLGNWEPKDRGHHLSVDDTDNSGFLYSADTEPADNGTWHWEVWAEDEWNVPMGNAGGTAATEAEAKAAAERWMRPERHLKVVPDPDTPGPSATEGSARP